MHLRYLHRDRHGLLDLDDRLEHQRLERQILVHLLDVGYRIQHRLDEVRHLDEERRLDVERRLDLGERQLRRLDEVRRLDVGHGPCPGLS
jgi:hypothetical protein